MTFVWGEKVTDPFKGDQLISSGETDGRSGFLWKYVDMKRIKLV